MKIIKEFREFAIRGSVIDLAVGIIIGGAFQKIVSSLVTDVITPLVSFVTGGINFADRVWTLPANPISQTVITMNYGHFIQNVVEFLIVAFVIFLMVKGINVLRRKTKPTPETAPEPTKEEKLLIEIRDLLKTRRD
jgi:large conductance mechanosensitive channel